MGMKWADWPPKRLQREKRKAAVFLVLAMLYSMAAEPLMDWLCRVFRVR